jgi:DNA-binding NtrC family response regulator
MATILLVDDELNALTLRKILLERAGHRVLSASSGAEALRIFSFQKPDLVLTDQVMQGMTGVQLTRAIKALDPEMPVIIITGLNDVPKDAGLADLFMSKLEGSAKLLRNIEMVLQRGASASDQDASGSRESDLS